MKTKLLLLLSFIFINGIQAQLLQQGASFNGGYDYGGSYHKSYLSGDGKTLAISDLGYNTFGGQLSVYRFSNNTWQQMGSSFLGSNAYEGLGHSVDLSYDGNRIIYSSPYANANYGECKVFDWDGSTWNQVGTTFSSSLFNLGYGIGVSINDNGSKIAILEKFAGTNFRGELKVYELVSGTWTQVGNAMSSTTNDDSPDFVELSGDGNSLILGAPNYDLSNERGKAMVFRNNSGTWAQVGSDFIGNFYDNLGKSFCINYDGTVVGFNYTYLNESKVFKETSGTWVQKGQFYNSNSIWINGDGKRAVSGYVQYNSNSGTARIFEDTGSINWKPYTNPITGVGYDGIFTMLSNNGKIFVTNAENASGGGVSRGVIRVFRYFEQYINVKGNNQNIAYNNNSPSLADSTHFGNQYINATRSYTIESTGTDTLNINNVYFTGTDAANFSVVSSPAKIADSSSGKLYIKFTASTTGTYNAIVNIVSNALNEDTFRFAISASRPVCNMATLAGYNDTMTNDAKDSSGFHCGNWYSGTLPDSFTNIVIKSGAVLTIKPNQTFKCHHITILHGGKLLMKGGILKLYGNIQTAQIQSFKADSGKIILTGTDTNKIINCIPRAFNVEINKPSGIVLFDGYGGIEVKNHVEFTKGIIRKDPINGGGSLEIMNGGSSTEGNTESFAACRVQKYGSTNFIFPTGKGTKWARCGIENFSGTTCGAEYFDAGFGNYDTTAPLNNVSVKEYWDIGPDGGSADIKLYWEDTELSGIDLMQNANDLRVAHFNYYTNKWEDMGNTANSFNNQGWVTSTNVNDFSPFTFGSLIPAIPLPVNFISFTAKKASNNTALIKWQTVSEINNSHFEIERSLNGVSFIKIGTVKANNNSNEAQNYQYTDNAIANRTPAAFYRIKQVDYNGKSNSTNVQLVNFNLVNNSIAIYPNPTSSILNISLPAETEKATVTITDAMGKEVFVKEITTSQNINLAELENGIYNVNIVTESETKNIKLLKQ